MCGKVRCEQAERRLGADLGLYSVTFNNDVALDHATLAAYKAFREEAAAKGFRHFLEVFDPNALRTPVPDLGRFINDMIVRALAGVAGKARPLFLKIVYHGPAAMEQLVAYDSRLVVGILGGASGTTLDAFQQLWEAKKYGARVALYGRMINNSEHQGAFIEHLRAVADDQTAAGRGGALLSCGPGAAGHRPYRSLEDDLQATGRGSAYGGGSQRSAVSGQQSAVSSQRSADSGQTVGSPGAAGPARRPPEPDFSKMSPAEKIAWNRQRWNRILG